MTSNTTSGVKSTRTSDMGEEMQADGRGAALSMSKQIKNYIKKSNVNLKKLKVLPLGKLRFP